MCIGVYTELEIFTKCLSRSCDSDDTTGLLTYSVIIVTFVSLRIFCGKHSTESTNLADVFYTQFTILHHPHA